MPNPVVHWEIGGKDLKSLEDFYAKAFGWTIRDGGPGYRMVDPADGGLGGGLMQARAQIRPYVTVYVQVDELETALDTIADLGGTPLVPPTRIDDTASFALFRDPEGNVVGLLRATGPIAG